MIIKKSDQYKKELKVILEYIARDKVSAMVKLRKELNAQIDNLVVFPYKFQISSYYHNEENIRDMIYKGYTIIYEITQDTIEIQTIFNQNLPILKGK